MTKPRKALFLGTGFMLLETRSITQVALLFGATWLVTALLVACILAAIFVPGLLVLAGRSSSARVSYALLVLTLALGYCFPFSSLLALPVLPRLALAALVVGLPIVWAAFIFSSSFKVEPNTAAVFGSNLLGVVFGGALEYTANRWGLNALYLVALGLYLASLATWPGLRRSAASE